MHSPDIAAQLRAEFGADLCETDQDGVAYTHTVRAWHGSISAEHGIGQAKVAALQAHKSAVELALMRRIRQTLAQNTFNPDKVIALSMGERT